MLTEMTLQQQKILQNLKYTTENGIQNELASAKGIKAIQKSISQRLC